MDALQRLVPVLTLVIALAALVAAIGLWRAGGTGDAVEKLRDVEERRAKAEERRACIEAAVAKYPPVGVSAFVTRDRANTGPIKLSYIRERARAVDRCK